MAVDGEEETEYESDPEEAKMSLKMRRREASDDEDVDEKDGDRRGRDVIVDSEAEFDGQGAAAEYGEEYDDEEEDEYYDEQEEEVGEGEDEYEVRRETGTGGGKGMAGEVEAPKVVEELAESGEAIGENKGEEEKKENEPFAVPTSGAFYMHDDRFRDNAGARNRRTIGGRKLWESKDNRKWGHDKFEELSVQDRHYEEGRRSSKGYYRGRGKARVAEGGYSRGNRPRGGYSENNQNVVKDVKGRGPRRYQPSMKNKSEVLPPQNKQSAKQLDKTSVTGSGRIGASTTFQSAEHELVTAKKVASSLSSASPPFYPSGSSNKDVTITQKKETQALSLNRNVRPSAVNNSYPTPHSNSLWRGKNVIDSAGMDKLHIDDSVSPASARTLNNVHLPSASSTLNATQKPQSRAEAKGMTLSGSAVFQHPQTNNQVNKTSVPVNQAAQRNPVQNRIQPSLQPSVQHLGQHSPGTSQGSSPPKTGKGSVQGAGMGSLVYSGAQVMGSGGNNVSGHGDQNLPAFFPVMQFGGQRPGGIGVPAVGMAFPGYVAQPNGLGNSEMTWLPVLASAAGAMGATYCPPYIAVDGSYHPRPTGQTSTLPAPSKDNNPSKPSNELKPQQRSEVANHDLSQRQNKPRRYSEMKFSQ